MLFPLSTGGPSAARFTLQRDSRSVGRGCRFCVKIRVGRLSARSGSRIRQLELKFYFSAVTRENANPRVVDTDFRALSRAAAFPATLNAPVLLVAFATNLLVLRKTVVSRTFNSTENRSL